MTVQNVVQRVTYLGNGAQTVFAFTFRADDPNWIIVDYTDNLNSVSLNVDQDNDPGGEVIYSVAPPVGQQVQIVRSTPLNQILDYTRYDAFDSDSHESALDKLTMMIQDLVGNEISALSAGLNGLWEFVDFAGDRTLELGDKSKMLRANGFGGSQLITVPQEANIEHEIGTQISVVQKGTSSVSWVGEGPVVVNSPAGNSIYARYGTVTFIYEGGDVWLVAGNISP